MERRRIKESEEEVLKKIADADAVNKGLKKGGMGSIGRINDRDFVKNLREPGKFNAMTYANEYGKRLE